MKTKEEKREKKIAVVGAGIYGCTVALKLAKEGYAVDLIEKEKDIMLVSNPISLRAHAGYFYSRSPDTIKTLKKNASLFQKTYPKGIVHGNNHYYLIAKHGSKITGKEFLKKLDKYELPYKKVKVDLVNKEMIDECVKVNEKSYDPDQLRNEVKKKLKSSTVNLMLNTDASKKKFDNYDLTIITGYASNNDIANTITGKPAQNFDFRLCEKIIVKLPKIFYNKNFVVLDGPFFQIDPYGKKDGVFALSHAVHSVHSHDENISLNMDKNHKKHLAKGIVKKPIKTNATKILDDIAKYIPLIKKAKILGSIFAVKVLPPKSIDDSRPTIVMQLRKDVLVITAGKVSGSIEAAEECLKYAKKI